MSRLLWLFLPVVLILPLLSCGGSRHAPDEKYFLIATNVKVPYWQEAAAGLNKAAAQLHVKAETVGPDSYDPKAEHENFQDVLKKKPSGILVSASDPAVLKDDIAAAIAKGVPVITMDSDAPESGRLAFVGTDNYKAGAMGARRAANLLKFRGSVVIYTMPQQTNLNERLRGYQDVFEGYPQIKIAEVVDIKGDPRIVFDKTTELIEKNVKVDAFICLASIAGPEVSEVLERKRVSGKVVVAMDTDARTLEGTQKGTISATIAQKPFTMAFFGLKMLDDLHHNQLSSLTKVWSRDSFSPIPTFVDTGATLIDKDNVDRFLQERSSVTAK
ncbi:MAG: substrate-binding domain-containing protein [Acidobacteriales bacterium]|nr:substrate-binding domain-containing protein [Terriglobales bacterium]